VIRTLVGPGAVDGSSGIEPDHVIDVQAPGLVAEAFDLGCLATQDGPWPVRLGRVVDALASRADLAAGERGDDHRARLGGACLADRAE